MVMILIEDSIFVCLLCKSKPINRIHPRNGIHSPINFLIGGNVINNLNPLQVPIKVDLIGHNVVFAHELQQGIMYFHPSGKLFVLFGGKQLSEVEIIMAVYFLQNLDAQHVLSALYLVAEHLQHVTYSDVGLPGGDLWH